MKVSAIAKTIGKVIGFTLMAVVLLVLGLIIVLYSPWAQKEALDAAMLRLGHMDDGTQVHVGAFALRFPLKITVEDVDISRDGSTLVAAESLEASVNPLGLLIGNLSISDLQLRRAAFVLGSPDSAMYMTIAADSLGIAPAHIVLADMDIVLDEGAISGGRVAMALRPDTVSSPPSEPTKMAIHLGKIRLDDFEYSMQYLPTIDTLSARLGHAILRGGRIDMLRQEIELGSLTGNHLNARYISPDSATIAAFGPVPEAPTDSVPSEPWTVTIDSISFSQSSALYATAGVTPLPGLNFDYIQFSNLDLGIHDFLNRGTTVRIPLEISGLERCGIDIVASGTVNIDSIALNISDLILHTTADTHARLSATLGMGDMASDPQLPVALELTSAFAPSDIAAMFPAATPITLGIPEPIELTADIRGTMGHIDINTLNININRCINLGADGWIGNPMNLADIEGHIALNGRITNVNSLKNRLLDPSTAQEFNIPPMTLVGRVDARRGTVDGSLRGICQGGSLGLSALWKSRVEDYTVHVAANSFPIQAFMPLLGVNDLTARLDANGHGYSPFARTTTLEANAAVEAATFRGVRYSGITAHASLADGHAQLNLNSDNADADFTLTADGNLDGDTYAWRASLDGRNVDLHGLGFSPEPTTLELSADLDATLTPATNTYSAHLALHDLYFRRLSGTIAVSNVDAHLQATDSLTDVAVTNRDLSAHFAAPCGIDTLVARFAQTADAVSAELSRLRIEPDSIHLALPEFVLTVNGNSDNLVNDILAPNGISLRRLSLFAANDSSLHMDMNIRGLATSSMVLDSIFLRGNQNDSILNLHAGISNRPGNMDQLNRVRLDGAIGGNSLSLKVNQSDVAGRTGFDIGAHASIAPDSTITLSINPLDPTIGYQQWSVNEGNYLRYSIPTHDIHANLRMTGGNSALAIFTEAPTDSLSNDLQRLGDDLVVKLTDIHIQDWISFNPFAPPMKGDVSANMRLNRLNGRLLGHGNASVGNFTYGRQRVADLQADFDVSADRNGAIRADLDVLVDNVKTMTLRGELNDSTASSPFNLDFSMIRFPLATVNPFLPTGTAKLSGMLNGTLNITGDTEHPIMNGFLDFDSTAVNVTMLGARYAFSNDTIPVTNSVVRFNRFAITGANDKPLTVDGSVDISDLANTQFDLALAAHGTQIVNSRRASRGADVYGKAFIDLDAAIRGNMNFMTVDATATVLPETNVTYVMPEAESQITNRSAENMVKFVNFTDSAAVLRADSLERRGMLMLVDVTLNIESGSIINVDLNTEGSNKVQIQSNGSINFTMTPMNSGRLTGRIDIDNGFARYGMPPILSEQLFTFQRGSYVAFRGDMMNPTLNIHAVNVVKANVTQSGSNSRLVNFNVLLGVTGTLDRMDVAFDMNTIDDIAVENELESMSPEQRANQAMNLMLYHVYTGPGTKATSSLGNPLYTFLAGQLNEWAANTIKGVDISFGVDQYERTIGGSKSQTTSYSYQVSKSLFNDRFKIVIGGNYSTDADVDENFSQNLINDISFEYFLNANRTMYVRLFRHTGFESILEGEITQTGVGFVYRRKLQRLGDMFLPQRLVNRRIQRENNRLEQSSTSDAQ